MASHGGSLFCSWTCPEQGSHTVGLDGSLFKKEQGGHTFSLEPHGAAMACCPIPGIPRGQPCIKIEEGRGGHGQYRPRTSPRPGVRVHGSTHRPFQPVTASGACAGEADGTLVLLSFYYSWNGGRAGAVCAGENAMRRSKATACIDAGCFLEEHISRPHKNGNRDD